MIDFRYHLVSIVAVFLALAIGLLLGSTNQITEAGDKFLQSEVNTYKKTNQELRDTVARSEDLLKGENQFAQAVAPATLAQRLSHESVLFVMAPGAQESVRTGLDAAVRSAGGTVRGWISLTDKFLADDQVNMVDQLALSMKPANVTFPEDAGAYDKAGTVLANLLVTKEASKAGSAEVNAGTVLDAFKDQGFLTVGGNPGARATLAIVIAPKVESDKKVDDVDNKALVSVTAAFDNNNRGTIAAGPPTSAGAGGLIGALRDSSVASIVSTVDTADSSTGQIVSVLALNVELTGKSGKYGIGSGVNGYLPVPLPAVPTPGGRS